MLRRFSEPDKYINQKTIIKGDEKDVFIACASIVAKVSRDRLMCRLALKYPNYALEIHKGYGTKLHYSLLQKHGLSKIHRKSFCLKIGN
jgi:ribonuclease HII